MAVICTILNVPFPAICVAVRVPPAASVTASQLTLLSRNYLPPPLDHMCTSVEQLRPKQQGLGSCVKGTEASLMPHPNSKMDAISAGLAVFCF